MITQRQLRYKLACPPSSSAGPWEDAAELFVKAERSLAHKQRPLVSVMKSKGESRHRDHNIQTGLYSKRKTDGEKLCVLTTAVAPWLVSLLEKHLSPLWGVRALPHETHASDI